MPKYYSYPPGTPENIIFGTYVSVSNCEERIAFHLKNIIAPENSDLELTEARFKRVTVWAYRKARITKYGPYIWQHDQDHRPPECWKEGDPVP